MANTKSPKNVKKVSKNTKVQAPQQNVSAPKESVKRVGNCAQPTSEAMKYFFFTVEICRAQTMYHNGDASALSSCFALEERWRSYINSILFQLSQDGWENVPDYIPSRVKKGQSNNGAK